MATKYQRETTKDRQDQILPGTLPFSRLRQLPPRHRLTLVYLGIGAFSVAMLVANRAGFEGYAGFSKTFHAAGVVLERASERPELEVEFRTRSGTMAQVWTPVEHEAWERFKPGDRIGVVYRQSWSGKRVEVVETGLFALQSAQPVN